MLHLPTCDRRVGSRAWARPSQRHLQGRQGRGSLWKKGRARPQFLALPRALTPEMCPGDAAGVVTNMVQVGAVMVGTTMDSSCDNKSQCRCQAPRQETDRILLQHPHAAVNGHVCMDSRAGRAVRLHHPGSVGGRGCAGLPGGQVPLPKVSPVAPALPQVNLLSDAKHA